MSREEGLETKLEKQEIVKYQLELLLKSHGWKLVTEYYQMIRISRRNQIFGDMGQGMDGLVELGKLKSELAGMDFIMSIPVMMTQEASDEETAIRQEMEMQDDLNNEE